MINKTKICTICKEEKPRIEFSRRNKTTPYVYHMCKICFNLRQKKRRNSNRDFIKEIKSKLSCNRCGESHPACLQFHHTDPNKKEFAISTMNRMAISKSRILKEISKCEVLCANCHFKHHWEEEIIRRGESESG